MTHCKNFPFLKNIIFDWPFYEILLPIYRFNITYDLPLVLPCWYWIRLNLLSWFVSKWLNNIFYILISNSFVIIFSLCCFIFDNPDNATIAIMILLSNNSGPIYNNTHIVTAIQCILHLDRVPILRLVSMIIFTCCFVEWYRLDQWKLKLIFKRNLIVELYEWFYVCFFTIDCLWYLFKKIIHCTIREKSRYLIFSLLIIGSQPLFHKFFVHRVYTLLR